MSAVYVCRFRLCRYRYTGNHVFLDAAVRTAEFYVNASGADQVPLWDFDAVAPQAFKDTSSAAITASALLELARATGDAHWHAVAQRILYSLGTEQGLFAPPGSVAEAVLIANEHDCGYAACTVIETDYYLFEALRRLEGKFP
jgi:unsaturated chondroitin disaccharide hydrolase